MSQQESAVDHLQVLISEANKCHVHACIEIILVQDLQKVFQARAEVIETHKNHCYVK